jgi:hypothetical protein
LPVNITYTAKRQGLLYKAGIGIILFILISPLVSRNMKAWWNKQFFDFMVTNNNLPLCLKVCCVLHSYFYSRLSLQIRPSLARFIMIKAKWFCHFRPESLDE